VIYEHIRPFKRETTQQLAEARHSLAFEQIHQQDMGEDEAVASRRGCLMRGVSTVFARSPCRLSILIGGFNAYGLYQRTQSDQVPCILVLSAEQVHGQLWAE
jgi:hypothetical protein